MILERPDHAWALYVFAHGAGAGMTHSFMTAMATELSKLGIATLRYDFPYMAEGKRRIDPKPVLEQSVRDAVAKAPRDLPLFAGGKSMGGRMTSQAQAAQPLPGVRGLAFIGFPLHPAKEPATKRADHLSGVTLPVLFLQGTRDDLADLTLLQPIVERIPLAKLHIIEGADHSFHVLKRSGRTDAEVLTELAGTMASWFRSLL
ncbi:MAG TPA: alpha/beta family hydrolase [Myxococcales bacterium]|nr:alpha/beta family hydrolase [Myxococcales bacterium]